MADPAPRSVFDRYHCLGAAPDRLFEAFQFAVIRVFNQYLRDALFIKFEQIRRDELALPVPHAAILVENDSHNASLADVSLRICGSRGLRAPPAWNLLPADRRCEVRFQCDDPWR
jgi:hypothetical protein